MATTPVMYVLNLITNTKIEFKINPEEISEEFTANYEEITPRGRSGPIQGYESSGPRNVSFSVTLHEDYCDKYMSTIDKLRALPYPGYSGRVEPPKCYVRLGNMIAMIATPRSVSITWSGTIRDGHYTSAEVSFSFVEVNEIPLSVDEVEKGVQ